MRTWLVLACCLLALSSRAAGSLEEREAWLAARLRCVVCQNQTVAESNAPLAADMRSQIREQLAQGRSDEAVLAFFEQRYGAFVRYDPPLRPVTWLLWGGPFLLLVLGLAVLLRLVARRGAAPGAGLTPAQKAQAEAWLREGSR